jgi:hypothetical protein
VRGIGGDSTLDTDYLVVGAGALGMAFVDSLIEHCDADVVMVERRHAPGGHWLDAYPFVQLHQPSRYYGVHSTPLGQDRPEPDTDVEFWERASGAEICAYFDEVLRRRLLTSGRVRFFPMSEYLGERRFRSRVTGAETEVAVRRAVVDATYMASRVPATDPPPFAVADGVRWVPVGGLATLGDPSPGNYVIVGSGKTATDAIGWLLDRGTDPDAITWIRPRDAWQLNRAFFQPGQPATFEGVVLQLEAMVASDTVEETYERLEADGMVLRVDRGIVPTMMKGATISVHELEQLRRVERVVRLGHVVHVEPDRIVLEEGSVPVAPGTLHVHCASAGLSDNPPVPIFTDDVITLQLVTRLSLTLSGALQGLLEGSGRTTEEKNGLCPPTVMPHTPFDYLRCILAGITTEVGWTDARDLVDRVDGSRLNLMSGLDEHPDRDRVKELQRRFFTALFPAIEKLQVFAAQVTPRERARIYDPSRSMLG